MLKNLIGHSINDIYWYILPAILPSILVWFGLSYKSAGGLITIYLSIIAFFSLLFGGFADLYAREEIIGIGFIVSSVGLILSGLAQNLYLFIIFIALAALGVSTFHPAAYSLIGDSGRKKGEEYGKFEAFGILGILIMYMVYGFLIKYLNWKGILLFTGIPGLIISPFFLKRSNDLSDKPKSLKSSYQRDINENDFSKIIYLFLFSGIALRIFSITSIISFIPIYLVHELNFSPSLANYFASLVFFGGTLASLYFGKLSDQCDPMLLIVVLSGLTAVVIFFISIFTSLYMLGFLLFLLGGSWIGFFPPQNRILIKLGEKTGRGRIFGILTAIITFTNAIGPGIFGLIADRNGLLKTFSIFTFPALLGFIALLSIYNKFDIEADY